MQLTITTILFLLRGITSLGLDPRPQTLKLPFNMPQGDRP